MISIGFGLGVCKRPLTRTVLMADDFSETALTDLDEKSLDIGPEWEVITGAFASQNGIARTSSQPGLAVALAPQSHGLITAVFSATADAGQGGLVVRYQDADNYWLVLADWTGSLFKLVKVLDGEPSIAASTAFDPAANLLYEISVLCSGDDIFATLNGANAIDSDGDFSLYLSRRFGIYGNSGMTEENHDARAFVMVDAGEPADPNAHNG